MASSLLAGKSALVTGSASLKGLGYGILRTLAAAGCNVGMHGIMEAGQLALQSEAVASEFGVKAVYSTADLTKPAEIRRFLLVARRNAERASERACSGHEHLARWLCVAPTCQVDVRVGRQQGKGLLKVAGLSGRTEHYCAGMRA